MHQVIIEIDSATAAVTVSVKGVKGKACKALTLPVEEALGETTSSKPTAEYSQQEVTKNAGRNRNLDAR